MSTNTMNKSRGKQVKLPVFSDYTGPLVSVDSTWRNKDTSSSSSQTDTIHTLYTFTEQETQTGIGTEIIHDEVKSKYNGMTMIDFMSKKHKRMSKEVWRTNMEEGKVTVTDAEDCEVQTNAEYLIKGGDYIEYVGVACDTGTQTLPPCAPILAAAATATTVVLARGEGKEDKDSGSGDYGSDAKEGGQEMEEDIKYGEGKYDSAGTSIATDIDATLPGLSSFLQKASLTMENAFLHDKGSSAFDGYFNSGTGAGIEGESNNNDDAVYWKTLSVDFEKKKVLYPNWSKAKYHTARITRQVITRNRERIYDVEYDGGVGGGVGMGGGKRICGVREEYIRLIGINISSSASSTAPQEGVRVHCMVSSSDLSVSKSHRNSRNSSSSNNNNSNSNSTIAKGLPGRVIKVHRSGTFDIDCEGGLCKKDVSLNDIVIGLVEGQAIECRMPTIPQLQGTCVTWNSTGSTLGVSYGLDNITGWCDTPGALCLWNVFGRNFNSKNPDFTLEHPSCIMSCAFHPIFPSIVAAGSFNGEIVVWDLNTPDQVPTVSPIAEYSHKEPIMSLRWIKDGTLLSGEDQWLLVSAGADGRVLFWNVSNKHLNHPVIGVVLSKTGSAFHSSNGSSSKETTGKHQRSKSDRGGGIRSYPAAHGATAIAFSGGTNSTSRPQWLVCGTETGALHRGQTTRILNSPRLNSQSFVSGNRDRDIDKDKGDGMYPPINRGNENGSGFSHESHVGAVYAIDFSPFVRNLFLSCGSDGTLRFNHLLEQYPLRTWEPCPAPGTRGIGTEPFHPLSAVQFSPTRPCVFATSSLTGYVYVFDLTIKATGPVLALEAPMLQAEGQGQEGESSSSSSSNRRKKNSDSEHRRIGFTGMAFNHKQRGMIAACDRSGTVHIWKLGWIFCNVQTSMTSSTSGGSERTDVGSSSSSSSSSARGELNLLEQMECGAGGGTGGFSFDM